MRQRISSDAPGFIRQHRVLDRVVLPATAYLEMLIASAHEVLRADVVCVEDVIIREAMLFDDNAAPGGSDRLRACLRRRCSGLHQQLGRRCDRYRCLGAARNGEPSHWRASISRRFPRSSNCVSAAPKQWRQKNFTPASRAAASISETTSM